MTTKQLSLLLALVLAAPVFADQRVEGGRGPYTIHQQYVLSGTLVADTGSADGTALIDAALVQADNYWTKATLTIVYDADSVLIDSTRTVTFFDASDDSLVFPAFSDSIGVGDSFSLEQLYPPNYWVIVDSAHIDTSEIFVMNAGASITSEHLIEYSGNEDSVDTYIILQIAVASHMPNMQPAWVSTDSILYASQDTVVYKAWGAVQANQFRFILDPVEAPFTVVSNAVKHWGVVMVNQ